jgi:hypothetical protein
MSQTNTSDALSYIAHTFAEAYYGLLVDPENFSKLHTFYQLDAVFTRGDEAIGQANASTTSGLEGIKKELATFHHQVRNSEVTLKVMDSQYSVNQGIVITAVGSFNRLEGAAVKTRRFVQTFFLEAQTPHNYSIRNDILRYLNETTQQVVVAAKEEPKPQPVPTPAPTTTPSTNGTTDTHAATTAPAADSNGEAKKQAQEKKKPVAAAGSPTAARKSRQPRKGDEKKSRETKPEQGQEQQQQQTKPSKPATYANIVSGSAVAAGAPPVAEQPKPKATAPKQQQTQGQQQGQQQQQQAKPVKQEKKPKQEREGHSVYVGNLPFEATSEQVYNLFAKIGTIKDIALKRGYGFVDLASAEDLKKVVDHFTAHPAELDGRPLVIEDRKRGAAKVNAPRPQGQGQSQPKPAGAKRPKTGGKPNDNAAH